MQPPTHSSREQQAAGAPGVAAAPRLSAYDGRVDALKVGQDHFEFLNRLGETTRVLSDPKDVMVATARLLGRHLEASRCAYAEVDRDSNRFTIVQDYTNDCESTAGTYHLESFGSLSLRELRAGNTLVIRDVERELSEHDGAATFNAIGIKAIICCPLLKESGLRAMMAVHQTTPRDWTDNEILLVEEVVERCWASIERARAESQLQRKERQFHDLFEFAPDAMLLAPSSGIITLVNRQAEAMFGTTRSGLIGRHLQDLIPDLPVGEKGLEAQGGVEAHTHLGALRSDGTRFPVDVRQSPMEMDGELWKATAVRDVSEREKVQQHTLRTQRLESIGTLAGGVAHDLNNALAPILMAGELLRDEPGITDDIRELADTIETNARRGAAMVRQLLTFAKGVEGERLSVDVRALMEEMARIVTSTFPKNIRLHTNLEEGLLPVLGDMTQLHQVLLNLCVNARDAMPGGGELTLLAEGVNIDAAFASTVEDAHEGPHVMLRVADTGAGMSPELVGRIFEPFFSTKPQDKGTGLGLSTSLGIVRSHGGFLEVYSRPDRGTSFSVYLPVAPEAVRDSAPVDIDHPNGVLGNGELVLVVDDEPAVLEVSQRVLESFNFKTIVAPDGTEALIKAAEYRDSIRAVFSDLHMPHMGGIALTRALVKMLPEAQLVIMSGRLDDPDAEELRRLGVFALLNKPFTRARLAEILRDIFPAPVECGKE